MDEEILNTVHSMFGASVKIVDCEKSSSVQQEESLMINGVPIKLDGMCNDDAAAIKAALLDGQMPSVDLLNQLLYQAGLLRQPIQLETSLSVKSSVVTTEEVCVSKHGQVLNERTCETKEDYLYSSNQKEIILPVLKHGINDVPLKMVDNCKEFSRKEVNQKEDLKFSPQKSATYGTIPGCASKNRNDGKLEKPLSSYTSVDGSQFCDGTESEWSTNTSDLTQMISAASSRSLLSAPSKPLHSTSLNVISSNGNRSSISCDSGHDGVYHSISQSTAWVPQNRTGNSFSSCYDIASSSDELDMTNNQNKKSLRFESELKASPLLQYRKPQTLISFPLQNYIDKNTVLHYCDGKLMSGPIECFITHLIPTHDYCPEMDFTFTFLLCSRLFLTPIELLSKMHHIWANQQEFSLRASKSKIAGRLFNVLTIWMDTFPYDFRNETLMQKMRILTSKCCDIDQSLHTDITTTFQRLTNTLSDLNMHEEKLQSFSKPQLRGSLDQLDNGANKSADTINKYSLMRSESQPIARQLKRAGNCFTTSNMKLQNSGILNVCINPIDLAHQLTTIELKYFLSHVGAEELLHAFSPSFEKCIVSKVDEKQYQTDSLTNIPNDSFETIDDNKPNNLGVYVNWFNRLSYLTATEIVKCEKKKIRAQMIEYWIETARECFNTGNFNSLMAILAGLNLTPIRRLRKTWAKVQSAKFSVLEHQMDPTFNFNSYRSTMKAAVWRSEGSNDEHQCLIIPFFTLFLKDLRILNESCESWLPNGHINFEKCSLIAKQAQDFIKWKQAQCPYNELPNIIMFLQTSEIFNDKSLMLASFSCEAPDNGDEKERYKMLRSATN